MTVEIKLAELRTTIEQTLGPNGSITKTLAEIKADLKEGSKVMDDHGIRIDRLEQTQKVRSKLLWTAVTAWFGVIVAWVWDRLAQR